jgi:hypothetical protein
VQAQPAEQPVRSVMMDDEGRQASGATGVIHAVADSDTRLAAPRADSLDGHPSGADSAQAAPIIDPPHLPQHNGMDDYNLEEGECETNVALKESRGQF